MNPLVVTTVAITVGVSELARSLRVTHGKETLSWAPSFRPIVAGFVLGLFLLAIDEFAPQLTGRFCALIIITDLVLNGKPVFDYLGTL